MRRGKFVAIEGQDASGKATQSKLLASAMNAELISFPRYDTIVGKAILGNLKKYWSVRSDTSDTAYMDAATNALVRQVLFTADRYDAASNIKRTLDRGKNMIVDRFWASGLVYGASDAVPVDFLNRVHECLPQPDVWILIDIPVEESFRRRPERQDMYERDREKLESVRQRYLELFTQRGRFMHKYACSELMEAGELCQCDVRKWVVIDGIGTVEQVFDRIMGVI